MHVILISEPSQACGPRKDLRCCIYRTLALVEGLQQFGAASLSSLAQVREECLTEEMGNQRTGSYKEVFYLHLKTKTKAKPSFFF